jgi:hypothetical protein
MKKQPIPNAGKKRPAPELTPKQGIIKDADDLVHSQEPERPAEDDNVEEDPDDRVHRPKSGIDTTNKHEDPDDLVHGYMDEEADEHK